MWHAVHTRRSRRDDIKDDWQDFTMLQTGFDAGSVLAVGCARMAAALYPQYEFLNAINLEGRHCI
jgi:hypothetical protein